MAGKPVDGDRYYQIDSRLFEIKRQVRQKIYPFDPEALIAHLQAAINGEFMARGGRISLHDRILACHLDWFDQDILRWRREDQPCEPRGEVEVLDLGRDISTDDALSEITKRGYNPANIEELCNYGAKNPEEQRKYPIVALGSVFVSPTCGGRDSPYLDESDARRSLRLDWCGYGWGADCRFAVVRLTAQAGK